MAEREGFEPSRPLKRAYSLSRGALSASQPSLRSPCFSTVCGQKSIFIDALARFSVQAQQGIGAVAGEGEPVDHVLRRVLFLDLFR